MLKNAYTILIISLLSGCAIESGSLNKEPHSQSFASYAESVFRKQNNLISEMMIISSDEITDSPAYTELLEAEKSLHEACAPLNAYAEQQDTESFNVLLTAKVSKSIKPCDIAAEKLKTLLNKFNQANHLF